MVQQRRKTGKNKGSSLSIDDGQRHFLDEILAPAARSDLLDQICAILAPRKDRIFQKDRQIRSAQQPMAGYLRGKLKQNWNRT